MNTIKSIGIENLKAEGEAIIPGALVKLPIKTGTGDHVAPGSEVELDLKLTVRNQIIIESDPEKPYVKKLEQILPPGLSRAVSTMRRNERALVWMHSSLGFGKSAVVLDNETKIPKDTDLVFEVHLRQFNEAAISSLGRKDQINFQSAPAIEKDIKEADELIIKGRKLQALRVLKNCLAKARRLRIDGTKEKKEEKLRQNLIFVITAKTATCAYELGKYPQAVSLSKEALQIDRFDPHVNFICGCAYFSLGYINSALRFVRAAHHADVSNRTYEEKLLDIERHQALIEKDIDEDSDEEDFEVFAQYCKQKLEMNEPKFLKEIEKFINRSFEVKGTKSVIIGGGFRPELLKTLEDEILHSGARFRIIPHSDALELYWGT